MSHFTKSDIQNGDVILRRNGSVEIVSLPLGALISKIGFNELKDVNEDLTMWFSDPLDDFDEWDIIAIRRPKYAYECAFDAFTALKGDLVFEEKRDRNT